MDKQIEEIYNGRNIEANRKGDAIRMEYDLIVFDQDDETAAIQKAKDTLPVKKEGLKLSMIEATERINESTYKVRATYQEDLEKERDETDAERSFTFDTSGATVHITQSKTTEAYPPTAPKYNGAIGVDNDGNINGVDITVPTLNFTETHILNHSKVNTRYKQKVAYLTGKVNNSRFRGFDAGEVLFLGATGSRTGTEKDDPWEVTFRFAVSENSLNLNVGGIIVPKKRGWDYMWVRYADTLANDKKSVVKKPVAVYIEQVYEKEDFGKLGLGN